MIPSKRRFLLLAITAVLVAGMVLAGLWYLRRPLPALTYTGTESCAACHQDAYRNWLQSDHRHAMETAGSQSVLGDFKNAAFDYFGIQSRFTTRDGKYFVETDNARGELQTFQIAYTFGHYPLQQYLISFPDGRLQALSIAWDSRPAAQGGQRWYHLYPKEKVTHEDPLHWTGAFQNWNSRCASCHSTGLVKSYSPDTDRYDTHWKEINVGCEACHGPGSRHLAWAKGSRSLENKGLATLIGKVWDPAGGKRPNPAQADFSLSGQLQVCSSCHSLRAELRQPDVAASYFDNYSLSPLLAGRYYADGQIQAEVYETGSFLQSQMHQNHVSCTNCHEPHGGRVRLTGNKLCLQCHDTQKFQTADHFFHDPNSQGAQCVNCHMATETYMGVDVRRDHSFRVPDPIASVEFGVPNACTQCHKEKDNKWAADILRRRTGRTKPRYPYAALLTAARNNSSSVVPELLAYAQDAANPPILRSIAILESARFPLPPQLDTVITSLTSPDPLVRVGAITVLNNLDANERLTRLKSLLADPAKSVRMAVARQLIDMPLGQAPVEVRDALGRLFGEYKESLLYNADMPESMNDLGLFLAAQGDPDAAEKATRQALKLSPHYLPAMLNLSDIYRVRQHDDLGETVLREAVAAYPESGDARYALGLLYVRTGRKLESVALFQMASRLAPDNAQYAFVYAVALVENGKRPEGLKVLQAAAERFPDNEPIRQALQAYQSH